MRDSVLAGIGINAFVREQLALFVNYDLQGGGSGGLDQAVQGGLSWQF